MKAMAGIFAAALALACAGAQASEAAGQDEDGAAMHWGSGADRKGGQARPSCPGSSEWGYTATMLYKPGSAKPDPVDAQLAASGYKRAQQAFRGDNAVWVYIRGYVDSSGNPLENEKLAWNRARLLAKDLAARGVDSGKMLLRGYGTGSAGGYSNSTAEGRMMNRRSVTDIRAMDRQEAGRCASEHPESLMSDPWEGL